MPFVIRPATPADRPAVLKLFSTAFASAANPADWEWKYDRNPCPAVPVVAMDGGEAVGFFGAIGTRYRGAEGNLPGTASGDVMTHPAARALGRASLFRQLGETHRALNAARGIPFDFGFPHERARRIEERLLGCRTVERAGLFVRPVAPARPSVARRLGWRRLLLDAPLGRAHAALAERLHALPGWRTDRSPEVLGWRLSRPGVAYRTIQALDVRGRSRAFAAVRHVVTRALLVDLQSDDVASGALADVVAAACELAARDGMSTLEVRAPRAGLLGRRLEEELGFSAAESDTHFFVRPLDPAFDLERAARSFDYRYLDHDVF